MKLLILSVTHKIHAPAQAILNDYTKRMKDWPVELRLLTPANGEPAVAMAREAEAIIKLLPARAFVVLLDESGQAIDSPSLSQHMQRWSQTAPQLVFIIGGAHGVSPSVMKRADFIWSLSPLVFPHQLVQIILIEQLYRAKMIADGHPYHHA